MPISYKIIVDTTLSLEKTLNFQNLSADTVIDWGDGSGPIAGNSHAYSIDGQYEVSIYDSNTISSLNPNISIAIGVELYTVTTIGYSAFAGLGESYYIKFLGNIPTIERDAFNNDRSVSAVYVPSIEYWMSLNFNDIADDRSPFSHSPDADFYVNDEKVTSIIIPDTVTEIKHAAFYNINQLESVRIPSNVLTIGKDAFYHCENLSSIILEDGIQNIGINAFANTKWVNINIPNSVTSLGQNSFAYYSNTTIKHTIIIGSGLTSIATTAFWCGGSAPATTPLDISFGPSLLSVTNYAFTGFKPTSTNVYYSGTQEQWNTLLQNVAYGNAAITSGTLHLTHTVTYHPSVGTLDPSTQNPSYISDLPSSMPAVTATNWLVGNWYYDPSFTNQVTPGTTLTSNVNLYIKLYNDINYSLDGGINSALNPDKYTSLDVENAKLLHAPMKAGYDFDGWYLDSEFTISAEDMSKLNGSAVTLYAKFVDRYYNVPMEKTPTGTQPVHMDAYTVRGHDAFINVNLSTLTTMEDLYIKINDINALNEHAYFDMSSYVPGAYVCLISMQDLVGVHYCEINDLLHNRVYYAYDGFTFTEDIDEYIERCLVKDNYVSVKVSGLSNMGELVNYINKINTNGDHAFFDFSDYITGAYVCTIQCFQQSSVNYCFIFDILGGKLYGRYTGYTDLETITAYVTSSTAESDIVHAIRITDNTMTLLQLIQLLNKVNQIGHHVFFDVSAISSTDYLITFTNEESGSNTTCTAIGLVKGTAVKKTYATTNLATTTLSSFLATGSAIVNQNELNNFIVQVIQS